MVVGIAKMTLFGQLMGLGSLGVSMIKGFTVRCSSLVFLIEL